VKYVSPFIQKASPEVKASLIRKVSDQRQLNRSGAPVPGNTKFSHGLALAIAPTQSERRMCQVNECL
jgi:hypothetical protein